jgi:hypothetical protein
MIAVGLMEIGRDLEVTNLERVWARVATSISKEQRPASGTRPVASARRVRRRARTVAVFAAAAILVTGAGLLAAPGRSEVGQDRLAPAAEPTQVEGALRAATMTLADLAVAAHDGRAGQAVHLGRILARLRQQALTDGLDVSSLDARISRVLTAERSHLSDHVVRQLRLMFDRPADEAVPGLAPAPDLQPDGSGAGPAAATPGAQPAREPTSGAPLQPDAVATGGVPAVPDVSSGLDP